MVTWILYPNVSSDFEDNLTFVVLLFHCVYKLPYFWAWVYLVTFDFKNKRKNPIFIKCLHFFSVRFQNTVDVCLYCCLNILEASSHWGNKFKVSPTNGLLNTLLQYTLEHALRKLKVLSVNIMKSRFYAEIYDHKWFYF